MVDFSATIDGGGGLLYAGLGVDRALTTTITGQSSMNSTFIEALITASSTFTADLTVHPFFEIRNIDDILVSGVDYESVYAGIPTAPQILTFINHSSSQIDVTLTPKSSLTPLGTAIDTYQSQYLSLDGSDYSNVLLLQIPAYDSLDCYFKYQPPSTAKIGEKQWEVSQRDPSLTGATLLPGWFYAKSYTITGGTGTLTDARVLLHMDYVSGDMKNDFSDIRFTLTDGTSLDYEIAYKLDADECYFIITVPTLPATPTTTTIYAYSGNFTVQTSANTLIETVYNWLDGTLSPWTSEWGGNSVVNTVWSDGTHYSLHQNANWGNYRGQASVLSTTAYGIWTAKFKWTALDNARMRFIFINNGSIYNSSQYSVEYQNHPVGTGLFRLMRNDTVLDSASIVVDTEEHVIVMIRNAIGEFNVYLDDTLLLNATDTTITASQEIWLETLPISYTPNDSQWFDYDYVNVSGIDKTGSISESDWTFYVILECKGGILYKSREVPGLEPEIRHGCRIGGVYYE